MKRKNTMSSKYISFALVTVIILGAAAFAIYKLLIEEKNVIKTVVVSNSISGWDYTLDDRDTELMKTEFLALEKILKDEIDYKEYAKVLAKLYIIDLYTLNNKIDSQDIAGLEYVIPSYKEDYKNKVSNTIYKGIMSNLDGKRKQELPEVKSVEVLDVTEDGTGYKVKLTWEYVKDLGFDKEANLHLKKEDKKLYIDKHLNE